MQMILVEYHNPRVHLRVVILLVNYVGLTYKRNYHYLCFSQMILRL